MKYQTVWIIILLMTAAAFPNGRPAVKPVDPSRVSVKVEVAPEKAKTGETIDVTYTVTLRGEYVGAVVDLPPRLAPEKLTLLDSPARRRAWVGQNGPVSRVVYTRRYRADLPQKETEYTSHAFSLRRPGGPPDTVYRAAVPAYSLTVERNYTPWVRLFIISGITALTAAAAVIVILVVLAKRRAARGAAERARKRREQFEQRLDALYAGHIPAADFMTQMERLMRDVYTVMVPGDELVFEAEAAAVYMERHRRPTTERRLLERFLHRRRMVVYAGEALEKGERRELADGLGDIIARIGREDAADVSKGDNHG